MTFDVVQSATSAAAVAAKGSLVLALAWCATCTLRRASASTRHTVWLAATVGVLLMPALHQLKLVPLAVVPASVATLDENSFATSTVAPTPVRNTATDTPPAAAPRVGVARVTAPRGRATSTEVVFTIWALIATIMIGRLVLAMMTVARIVRRSRSVDDPIWTHALQTAAQPLGLVSIPRLVMSDEAETAFAFQIVRRVIVLPASADTWSADCRHSVLVHELAHLRRRDLPSRLVAGVAVALNWFNPLMLLAMRRLSVESELACDELVLGAGVDASDYAQHLLDMATTLGRRPPMVAMAVARSSNLEGRLTAILDSTRHTGIARRDRGTLALSVFVFMALSISAVALVPVSTHAGSIVGVAFNARGNSVAMKIESAAQRGRLEIVAADSAAPVLRNGVNLAPLGATRDYYLFDSTSFVLVRPASKTFAIFDITGAAYNFENRRDGWPQIFDFPATIATRSVSAATADRERLSRHGAFQVYWNVDAETNGSGSTVLARGRIGIADAPLGESTVAKWFGPALALAQLAKVDSSSLVSERVRLGAVAPLLGDNGATTNCMSSQPLSQLRIAAVDVSRLTLPNNYTLVSTAGSLTESQARDQVRAWRAPPSSR